MTTRQARVEELIREEVSDILRKRVSDPRIGFVSITAVEISPDLKNASIYVSILGEPNNCWEEKAKKSAMEGLFSATNFIQGELGHRLKLRVTPAIRFVQDNSLERGSRVLQIMNQLENEERIRADKKAPKKR